MGVEGFLGGSLVKNPPANAGDEVQGFNLWIGKIPWREKNDNPLQYSCLGNPMDRGGSGVTVPWGHKELDMTWRLTTKGYR